MMEKLEDAGYGSLMRVKRSYIGKGQKLVDEPHAKQYETTDRAETALADFVMRNPQYLGQMLVVLAT